MIDEEQVNKALSMPDKQGMAISVEQYEPTDSYTPKHLAQSANAEDSYTPVFSNEARTVVYVVCGILGLLGGVATVVSAITQAPLWLTVGCAVCAWAAPYIANMFGVRYNPVRMSNK
jgi:hypothetical protein